MKRKTRFYKRGLPWAIAGLLCCGCEEELFWDSEEVEPLPVLNCVMRADDDTVRAQVGWSKSIYDLSRFRSEERASVWVYADGEAVGEAVHRGGGWYALPHRVKSGATYRVAAWLRGRDVVWGETRVPSQPLEASITYDTLRHRVVNRWTDRPEEKNYYWLSYATGVSTDNTRRPTHFSLPSYIETNSTLADPFNRSFDFEEESPAEYDYYVRVEDAGLSGERLELEYRGDRSMYGYSLREGQEDGYYVGVHFILSLDGHYDHYLRSVITNREYAWDMDDLPLFYTPLWFYSNVTNGVGLVASYARFADVEERVFYKKEEEPFDDLYD